VRSAIEIDTIQYNIGFNPGGLGSRPPRFWAGGIVGGRGRVVKYYYVIMQSKYVRK